MTARELHARLMALPFCGGRYRALLALERAMECERLVDLCLAGAIQRADRGDTFAEGQWLTRGEKYAAEAAEIKARVRQMIQGLG